MAFDYNLFYKKPDKLPVEQWEAAKGQASELTPDKGNVWTTKLSDKGLEAYRNLNPEAEGRDGGASDTLTDKQKLDFLITTTRDKERKNLYNTRNKDARKKYKPLLEANAAKTRLNPLTDDEINSQLADENISEASGYTPKEIANNKLRLRMKHINGIYSKQIDALKAQRMELASELDTLRSQGKIDNAKRAQFEELGKQIELLNGKMYDGERAFKAFSESEETKENQLKLHNLYKQLSSPDLSEEQRQVISAQIQELESKVDQRAALDHWLAARKKEFEEHNVAIDKEREEIENKINTESEVKDGDIKLEHAVAKATGDYYQQVQEEGKVAPKGTIAYHEGETARTRAQRRIIEKFQEAADKKDTRTMQKILEQHPDIAKKVGYDPVIQRKFNRLKNSEKKVRKFAEIEKTVHGTEFSDDMIKLAAEARAKNPGMTAKQALETVRNQMLGVKTPTGETFVSPKDKQAAEEFIARQAEKNAALQAEAAKHKKQFDYMADRISKAVKAGNLTAQQGQLLLNRAKSQYETAMSTLAVKNGGGGKQQVFTPQPPTVRKQSVDGIVGNMLAVRDAETAQKFDSLSDADKAAQLIRMGYDYSQLPQRYRNALDNSDYVNISMPLEEDVKGQYDTDNDGVISEAEAKAGNIRVQTTYDEAGNPIQVFRNRHTDFSKTGNDSARAFFARDEFNKGDFSRLKKRIFKAIGDQYTTEQKQEMANKIHNQKLESEQRKNTYNTHRNIAEDALKKAQASYSNDYNVKYTKADIDKIAALIEEAKKQGKNLTQSDIEKFGKALVSKKNEVFLYGRAPNGVSQDVYHRLSESNGAKFINQSDDVKRAIALRYAQMMPKLNEAFEVAKTDKKRGAELLRKLEKEWHRKSESVEEGGNSRGIFFPFYGDLLKLEMDIAQKDLEDMDKANRAETNDKGEFIRDEHGNIKGGKIGRAWNDFIEFYKNGGKLDDFSKRFGGTLATYATTDGDIAYSPVSSDLEAIKGREDEFTNYLQHIRPELEKYTRLMEALKRHGRKFNEFEQERSF